jgi:hypothetical protein
VLQEVKHVAALAPLWRGIRGEKVAGYVLEGAALVPEYDAGAEGAHGSGETGRGHGADVVLPRRGRAAGRSKTAARCGRQK